MSTTKVTSTDIRNALKLRYEPVSHALLFEVANGTGAGSKRYADAVAVGLWPSHGHAIEGVEIKVSRSDFLAEMKDATKSQAVFRFCHRWWLACPRDMVKPEELPPTWGLLELMDNGTLRQRVKAPLLKPETPDMGFIASLMRRSAGRDEEMTAAAIRTECERIRQSCRDEVDRQVQQRVSERIKDAERGLATIRAIQEATGFDLVGWRAGDGLTEAVKLVQALNGRYGQLHSLRQAASAIVKLVDESGILPSEGGA